MFDLSFGLFIVYCIMSYFYMLTWLPTLNRELKEKIHTAPNGTKLYQAQLCLLVFWLLSPISLIFFVTR